MEDKLIEVLSQICNVVRQQGSLLPDEPYPDEFFTFWNFSSESDSFYDDTDHTIIYEYSVCFYSKNVEHVYEKLRSAIKLLRKNGFIVSGDGHSVASDEVEYTGRGIDVTYRKELLEV